MYEVTVEDSIDVREVFSQKAGEIVRELELF